MASNAEDVVHVGLKHKGVILGTILEKYKTIRSKKTYIWMQNTKSYKRYPVDVKLIYFWIRNMLSL